MRGLGTAGIGGGALYTESVRIVEIDGVEAEPSLARVAVHAVALTERARGERMPFEHVPRRAREWSGEPQ